MLRHLLTVTVALLAVPVAAQTAPPPAGNVRVAMETSAGRIVVDVDPMHAPISAKNFLRYVDEKRLDGVVFYRTVKVADHFGFVQFGPAGDAKRSLPAIKHEPTTLTGLKHVDGTLSTARLAPGTAHGEFTISVGDQPSFDADPARPGDNLGYAAFGHVAEGMDIVLKVFDAPVSPTKTLQGTFKGEVPETAVKILTARRVSAAGVTGVRTAP